MSCQSDRKVRPSSINLDLLHRPNTFESDAPFVERWLSPYVSLPIFPFHEGPLADLLIDLKGVEGVGAETLLNVCKDCLGSLHRGCIPDLGLSNHMFLGDVPLELKDLTIVEESMIVLCCTKCCILHLKADGQDYTTPTAQWGLKGNLIIYLQCPSDIAKKLPPSIEEITSPICILFIGAHPPSSEWLREKAKPLAVHANKVHQALLWLKTHNHLYKDIEIDDSVGVESGTALSH